MKSLWDSSDSDPFDRFDRDPLTPLIADPFDRTASLSKLTAPPHCIETAITALGLKPIRWAML